MEEGRNELQTMVGSNMFRNPVLGEHVENKQDGKVFRGAMNSGQNKDTLLCQSVNNHQDRITTRRGWKGFNEVHRDWIPQMDGDRELLQQAIRLVTLRLSMHTGSAGLTILFYGTTESRAGIVLENRLTILFWPGCLDSMWSCMYQSI